MSRYKFYTDNKSKVIVTSTYAGRTVRGVANCADEDDFDILTGEMLARYRCDVKVATKRRERASDKIDGIIGQIDILLKQLNDAKDYYNNSVEAERLAQSTLDEYLEKLKS